MFVASGTCQSVGCTVEGSHPHDIIDNINSGDQEIPEVSSTKLVFLEKLRIRHDESFYMMFCDLCNTSSTGLIFS